MQFVNNKTALITFGLLLLFLFPIGFFIYITIIASIFMVKTLDGKSSTKTATEVAAEMTPTQQTFFYLMKHNQSTNVSHNGEYSKLSKYETDAWNEIVETLRKEDS